MDPLHAEPLPAELVAGLRALGLAPAGTTVTGAPLSGGVASDIWRADLPDGPVCVKRALGRLRVSATWLAPTTRTANEALWLEAANRAVPGAACDVLGFDPPTRVLALRWLPPETYRNWKAELAAGRADGAVAGALGERLGRVHAAFAHDDQLAGRLVDDGLFAALRLEPYLVTTARAHPDLASTILALAERTSAARLTVVHGDVSPKNVLVGPDGPLLVDAECASVGDPAFDLAFCLNHLLLKAIWLPAQAGAQRDLAVVFARSYLDQVTWEPRQECAARAATLVPALALARIDGASPVEYLDPAGRGRVCDLARTLLADQPGTIVELLERWFATTTAGPT